MDIIKTFVLNNTSHTISIIYKDGEPLFRADEIGRVLGLKSIHTSMRDFDDDEKGRHPVQTLGGIQEITVLTKHGLYALLFQSRKEVAKVFRKWVLTVLDSISETGKYELEEQVKELKQQKHTQLTEIQTERLLLEGIKDELAKKNHQSLIRTFDKKSITYITLLQRRGDKMLIKIGSSDNIRERAHSLKTIFGTCLMLEVFECNLNANFERFMQAHELVKPLRFSGVIYNDNKSTEVFEMTEEQLKRCINTATRNVKQFRTQTIEDKLTVMMTENFESIRKALGITEEVEHINVSKKRNRDDDENDFNSDQHDFDHNKNDDEEVVSGSNLQSKRGFCSNGKVGMKIQQYSANGETLIKTWSQMIDVERAAELDACGASVRAAARTAKTYRGFRWAFLERDQPDDTVQVLSESMDGVRMNTGWVAELDLEQTQVTNVKITARVMALHLRKHDQSRLSKAIKSGQPYGERIYKMWSDVPQHLQDAFVDSGGQLPAHEEIRANVKRVKQIDETTGEVVKVWAARHHVLKEFAVSAKRLQKYIASGTSMNGFIWQDA